jgi:hypothetical protein
MDGVDPALDPALAPMLRGKHGSLTVLTMRTTSKLICECGHLGLLHTSENDQPFSGSWESHKLEGFREGGSDTNMNGVPLSPVCPQCGSRKVTYDDRT